MNLLSKPFEDLQSSCKLGMHFIMSLDGAISRQVEAVILSIICNTSSTMVRKYSSFDAFMKELFNYPGAFEVSLYMVVLEVGFKYVVNATSKSEGPPSNLHVAKISDLLST